MADQDKSLNGAATSAPDAANGNPLAPSEPLKRPAPGDEPEEAHLQTETLPLDSATTRAEKVERNASSDDAQNGHASKRVKLEEDPVLAAAEPTPLKDNRQKGVAAIKAEYVDLPNSRCLF